MSHIEDLLFEGVVQKVVDVLADRIMKEYGEMLMETAVDTLLNQNFKDLSEEVTRRLVKSLLKD